MSEEASFETDEIALGLTDYLIELRTLSPRATNYTDWGINPYSPGFSAEIEKKIREAKKIHFNLTGMTYLNDPLGVLVAPPGWNPRGSTNWELRTIWDDDILRRKTVFYLEGKIITESDVKRLP